MDRATQDILTGGATIAFAAFGWFVGIPLGVDVPGSVKILALSPDFWPRIIMGMLTVSGAIVLIQGYLARNAKTAADPAPASTAPPDDVPIGGEVVHFDTRGQFIRVSLAFIVLFIFYFLAPYMGFVLGCIILVMVSTRILGVTSWAKSVGLAIILPVLLYYFFTKVAQIPIPLGLFEDLL